MKKSKAEGKVGEAAEATMAAVEAAGCQSAADFLLTFSSSNTKVAADEVEAPPSPSPLDYIVLTGIDNYVDRIVILDFVEAYIIAYANEYVKWGQNALLFYQPDFGQPQDDLVRTLHALASIRRFRRLFLFGLKLDSAHECDALFHALSSPNFSELFVHRIHFEAVGNTAICNKSLRSLTCIDIPSFATVLGKLVLPSLTFLTSLEILHTYLRAEEIQLLFASLEESPRLTNLSLLGSYGSWASITGAVVDSLRRNALLHKVDLARTLLEGDSSIALQLRKNAQNSARLKSLGSELVKPSTVRLYLCGLPLSGKTTLSRSIARSSKGSTKGSTSHCLPHHNTNKVSDRTRGIEVTTVENQQEHQRISIWDMAGQIEYHSFHDSMLPDLSDRAVPPLFLYVWNPCEMDAKNRLARDKESRAILLKSPDQFESDFKYWLKFIASKIVKSNMFKPKIIVVITRDDLGLPNMKQYLESCFNALQNEFKEYIHFDMEGFFQVDARDSEMISELASHLFECTKLILREAPTDFKICDEARKVFTELIYKKEIPPLISKERFFNLTEKLLGIESEEVREAVALSLNSSGDLIYFPSLELVVVDTQWFCAKIMGDLLYFNMQSTNFAQLKGFFPVQLLQDLLEEEFNSSKVYKHRVLFRRGASKLKESLKVSGDALMKLLMGLRLACRQNYYQTDSRLFIPASLCGKARERIMPSRYLKLDGSCNSYVGRRWAVKDSNCTFLTPGIFPLLQVTFHQILSEKKIHVALDQDVMAFAFDGASVFVEFCRLEGQGNFIDVLVGSLHSVKEALEWIHENVTVQMKEVFADSRGLPGVDFVESVIQPASIQLLLEARDRQAVSLEVLHSIMSKHVQKKGATDGFESVLYTWQTKPVTHDAVVDLLGKVEVAKLVEAYRGSLSEAARDIFDLSNVVVERTNRRQKPTFGTSRPQKQLEAIYDLVCDVRDDVKGDIKQLAVQVEDFRGVVLPKLHQLFTFVREGEAGKLPRMFVVTQEVGFVRRVVLKVVPGLCNVRLELLCECRNQPAHLVDGQRGLSIASLDDGLLKRGLPYINGFLKVAYVVTKIGAHVALGFGEAIPDFTRVLAGILDTAECGRVPTSSGLTSSSRVDFGKGQQWLFDVLSHHNCTKVDQIYAQFGLRPIRYANSSVAWVCDEHYSGGDPFPATQDEARQQGLM